ncbi:MAG: hypothetical protein WA705_20345 [Candidatus Ozemobacteraceae bacterium]
MKFRFISRVIAIALLVFIGLSTQAFAAPEIMETQLINDILQKNLNACKEIRGLSRSMGDVAEPFRSPRYAAKFRFAPSDERSRKVLSSTRAMQSRFKTLSGILCNSSIPQRVEKFKAVFATIDSLTTATKRSIRAIKDGNFALYLAATQTIEKDALDMVSHISDIETMINQNIDATDKKREEL